MSISLAVKYRPKRFEDVVGQSATVKILQKTRETAKNPRFRAISKKLEIMSEQTVDKMVLKIVLDTLKR